MKSENAITRMSTTFVSIVSSFRSRIRPMREWNRRTAWVVAMLAALIPGWMVAFATHPLSRQHVAAFGAIAIVAALVLGFALWRVVPWISERAAGLSRMTGFAIAVTACGAAWVWLQYALNPFRVRSVFDAMSVSGSVSWQVSAGLALFATLVIFARMSVATSAAPVLSPRREPIAARFGRQTVLLSEDQIERVQGCDDYVAVFSGGQRLLASYRLDELTARLDGARFLRVHRSHIVNVAFIESTERVDANRESIRMRSGAVVIASRSGTTLLRRYINGLSAAD